MIHEPTVYDDGPDATPRYRIDWHGEISQDGDTVHMQVDLFDRTIRILNGEPDPFGPR